MLLKFHVQVISLLFLTILVINKFFFYTKKHETENFAMAAMAKIRTESSLRVQ